MARKPPPPPTPKRPKSPPKASFDPLARSLASAIREGYGVDQAATLDLSDQLGKPRGYVGTRNIALDRALGTPGIPLGRVTEISGWPGAGKSTILDQILSQCQAENGVAVLADTERARSRQYMAALGLQFRSLVWIAGKTVELMFDELETLARKMSSINAIAWHAALVREGVKCGKLPVYRHIVYDPQKGSDGKRREAAKFVFSQWGREQAAALLDWQRAHGLEPTSIRDPESRKNLRPVVLYGDADEQAEALEAWKNNEPHPYAQSADRPVVIGWDSVAGTATEAELEGDARDQHPATAAKVIRQNLRRLIQLIDDEGIAFVLVNQRYERLNMGFTRGPKTETYGGGGIKYHTTIRLEVDKIGSIHPPGSDGNKEPPMGQIVRIRVPKNKVESPFHEEVFGLIFGRGAENAWAIYEDLKSRAVIRVGGGWSRFTDPTILRDKDRSFRGWMELSNMMAEDPALWATLKAIYMEGR